MFVLFTRFGSPVPAVSVALFVKGPLPGALCTTKMFVPPPTGKLAIVFVTRVPSGSVSTTTTFVATDGPAFVTEITFVYTLPASTLAGPTFVTTTSATGVTAVTTGGLVLFVGLGSSTGPPTLATFVKIGRA